MAPVSTARATYRSTHPIVASGSTVSVWTTEGMGIGDGGGGGDGASRGDLVPDTQIKEANQSLCGSLAGEGQCLVTRRTVPGKRKHKIPVKSAVDRWVRAATSFVAPRPGLPATSPPLLWVLGLQERCLEAGGGEGHAP